eukprot:1494796-Rhodomonas_salina.1
MLPSPVDGRFPSTGCVVCPSSYVAASVKVPGFKPPVTTANSVLPEPAPTRHVTELSDTQSVPSHPVLPILPSSLYPDIPRLAPVTVKLARPVVGRLPLTGCVESPLSYVDTSDIVPDIDPAVTTARRVPPDPEPIRHATELSDTHPVPSHPVADVLTPTLYADTPRSDPLTVTLPCPVVPTFTSPTPDT